MSFPDLLSYPEESARLRAVEGLADEAGAETLTQLVGALNDRSWRVRKAAVNRLVRRGGNEAMRAVLAAMRSEHRNLSVLNGAIQILAQAGVDTTGTLIEFLHDADADLRLCAALTLGSQNKIEAIPALHRALADNDTNVRYHAIEALGRLRAAVAADALVAVAETRDFTLAFAALDALAAIGDGGVAERLLPLLDDDLLQAAVVDALGQLGDEESVLPLTSLLNRQALPAADVARALARLHDRCETTYSRGNGIAGMASAALTPAGVEGLVAALEEVGNGDLPALVRVLGWVTDPALDKTFVQMLSRPSTRGEALEIVVRRGAHVLPLLLDSWGEADLDTRRTIVLALGRLGHPDGVPLLLAALDDAELAPEAAGALAMSGDPRAYAPLLGLLGHRDSAVRRGVVSALNSLGHPSMAADVGIHLQDQHPFVRESAVRCAGYAGDTKGVLACCTDPSENVRRAAVEALAGLEDARVLPALERSLQDQAGTVRAAAVRTLGQSEDAAAWPLLREALRDPMPWVRYYAARSLGRHPDVPIVRELLALAQSDEAMQVRVAAVTALGARCPTDALPMLLTLADADDTDLACAALMALGSMGEALPLLYAALAAADPARRLAACAALGASGRPEVANALQEAAASGEPEVARAALEALERLGVPEAVQALIALTALPAQREACIAALARVGHGQLAALARGLDHAYLDVRRSVVAALARLNDARTLTYLRQAVNDPEAAVRRAALTALAHTSPMLRQGNF